MRQVIFLCCTLLPIIGTGCTTLSSQPCGSKEESAKTLFSWNVGPKDEEESEKNGNDAKETSEANDGGKPSGDKDEEEKDEIVTDRPDFTEASSTVGKGRIQLEAGYTHSRNKNAGIQNAHSYPEALLRVGMFADWLEIRVGQNFSNTRTIGIVGHPFSVSGGEDLYLGTKFALTEQKTFLPEYAVVFQMTVPTGPKSLTAGKTLPGMNNLYSWEVNDFFSIGASTQGNAAVDDDGHTYLELAQSVTFGYTFTEKFGAYTEWFAFFPTGAIAPGTTAQHYFNGGFTYKLTPLFQLDIRAGKGLSTSADDYFFGAGFAVKY